MMAELESKMERTEIRMIRWITERKTVQHRTAKETRCRGNCGCDGKMQTEVKWTCGKKGRC